MFAAQKFLAFVLCGIFLGAPAASSQVPSARVAAQKQPSMADLVPTGAQVLFAAPSFKNLESKIKTLTAKTPAAHQAGIPLGMVQGMLGPLMDQFDTSGPMLVALTLKKDPDADPVPVFVMRIKDPQAAREAAPEARIVGPFAVFSPMGDKLPKLGGNPLARGVSGGDLVLRVDAASMVALYRPLIEQGLKRMQEAGSAAPAMALFPDLVSTVASNIHELLDSVRQLELSITLQGGEARLDSSLSWQPKSPLATAKLRPSRALAMAATVPAGYPTSMALSMDLKPFMSFLSRLTTNAANMLEGQAEGLDVKKLMDQEVALVKAMSGDAAGAFRFGEQGLEMVSVVGASDTQALISGYKKLFQSDIYESLGIKVKELPQSKLGSLVLSGIRLEMANEEAENNPAALGLLGMLGKQKSLDMRYTTAGQLVVMASGPAIPRLGQVLKRIKTGGSPGDPRLQALLHAAGNRPLVAFTMDFSDLMRNLQKTMGAAGLPFPPVSKKDPPIHFSGYLGRSRQGVRAGLWLDLKPLLKWTNR